MSEDEDGRVYRKRKMSKNEDSDYYGYTDNNAGPIMDLNYEAKSMDIDTPGLSIYRKRKKNKIKMVRKVRKCKCK